MRTLTFFTWCLSFSGCSCDLGFDWDLPPDQCSVDSDCPADDVLHCNGVARCVSGFLGPRTCAVEEIDCGDGYCDEESDSCLPCTRPDDAPECASLPFDGGGPDAGPMCDPRPYGTLGAWCFAGTCDAGLECLPTLVASVGPLEHTFRSICTNGCDPSAEESGCGACDACVDTARVGEQYVSVSELGRPAHCAPRCEPMRAETGCSRGGTSCDLITGTCQDACTSDQECRLVRDESGALIEDPESAVVCDRITGRCRRWGTLGARIGDACEVGSDCTIDGICMRGEGWPETGYCTRLDCQWAELACEEGEQCHHRAFDRPGCTIACTVFAEVESDRLGSSGHGEGCPPGLSCRWDGHTFGASPNGGCVPGNYNDVAAPNLGAPCTRDDECHSPFGLGRCAFAESGLGSCAIVDCSDELHGIACGEGAACTAIGEDMYCVRACASADECAPGQACTDVSGSHVCAPSCASDTECRSGERCDGAECEFGGVCRCVATP